VNLVILGGGISGLLAARAFRHHRPTLIEASPTLGGSYLSGGLKYIRATRNFEALLEALAVPWEHYRPQGGLLTPWWEGAPQLLDHPGAMQAMGSSERIKMQQSHWTRTRGTSLGFRETCMNDPMGEGNALALKVDHRLLMDRLSASALEHGNVLTGVKVEEISQEWVGTSVCSYPYTHLITTLPIVLTRKLAPWLSLPIPTAKQLSVAFFTTRPSVLPPAAELMDYVYTPGVPYVHRISRSAGSWQAEAAGDIPQSVIDSSVGGISHARSLLMGHLIPFDSEPQYPKNVAPLGRFAEWDTRSEAEKTLDRAIALAGEWS
jgi:hypothetical protein